MRVAVSKIFYRHLLNSVVSVNTARKRANEHNIEEEKEWCRESIRKRLEMDSLKGDLDKIQFEVEEIWDTVPKYKIIATLEV